MGKGRCSGSGKAMERHKEMKEKAKSRVDELQGIFSDLQSARKDCRSTDASVLEDKAHRILADFKSDLDRPSPASSLQAGSLGSFSSEIYRLLHLGDEEDDATSALPASKPEPDSDKITANDTSFFQGFNVNQGPPTQDFRLADYHGDTHSPSQNRDPHAFLYPSQLEYHHSYDLTQDVEQTYSDFLNPRMYVDDLSDHVSSYYPSNSPPPSAFLGPKCSRWDCTRPAQGLDHCSRHCADLALKEGPPGMTPVLRPCGIGLKECLLFAVLNARAQNKDVGIPECEGAATAKCPWNAPELFDISVLEGETIREWLFFDKPRRAFENGNRKQRSLPDYTGRGWHESRKQVMNEFNGQKRSYYMDPQPRKDFEWHLYEYEIPNFDECALYRLEYKRVGDKKSPKGKSNDSVADLQKQMGRLTAEFPAGSKRSGKAKAKASPKDGGENISSVQNQFASTNEGFGAVSDYLVADLDGYYYDEAEKR